MQLNLQNSCLNHGPLTPPLCDGPFFIYMYQPNVELKINGYCERTFPLICTANMTAIDRRKLSPTRQNDKAEEMHGGANRNKDHAIRATTSPCKLKMTNNGSVSIVGVNVGGEEPKIDKKFCGTGIHWYLISLR